MLWDTRVIAVSTCSMASAMLRCTWQVAIHQEVHGQRPSTSLEPIVIAPTHENNLLDKIFVNLYDVYATNVHGSLLKTKHKLVHIFPFGSKHINDTSSRAKITIYDTKAHNIDKLRFVLGTYNWQCIYDETKNVDIAYIMFLNALHNCITKCIPTRTVGCSQKDAVLFYEN